jgi:SAM-dependent methyltransferase
MGVQPEQRLTDEHHWNKLWQEVEINSERRGWRRFLYEDVATRLLWRILPRLLPRGPLKMIELGSAPGRDTLRWRKELGYDIYGADFSQAGVDTQKQLFASYGIGEDHTFRADIFDPAFHSDHRYEYDVVYSGGLIEHFSDPRLAIEAHLEILRPGGYLVIGIPNFVGLCGRLLSREVLETHNLDIMRLPAFRALFNFPEVQPLFCAYYGALNLGLGFGGRSALHRLLPKLQIAVNVLTHALPWPENRWTSPYLLFVGRKHAVSHE